MIKILTNKILVLKPNKLTILITLKKFKIWVHIPTLDTYVEENIKDICSKCSFEKSVRICTCDKCPYQCGELEIWELPLRLLTGRKYLKNRKNNVLESPKIVQILRNLSYRLWSLFLK